MISRRLITRVLIGAVVACGVALIAATGYQVFRVRLCQTVLKKIDRLALQAPDGIPELEWAARIYWTYNMHGATVPQVHAPISTLRELDAYLDEAISRGPSIQTIDELRDRYAAISEGGSEYRRIYRPRLDAILESMARDGKGYFDVETYRSFLESVRLENPPKD